MHFGFTVIFITTWRWFGCKTKFAKTEGSKRGNGNGVSFRDSILLSFCSAVVDCNVVAYLLLMVMVIFFRAWLLETKVNGQKKFVLECMMIQCFWLK